MGLAARERPPADAAVALALLLSLAACHEAGTGASPVVPCDGNLA